MPADQKKNSASADLPLRLVAALVLAPFALAAAWVGSWFYAAIVVLGAATVVHEWLDICGDRPALPHGALILAAMGAIAYFAASGAYLVALGVLAIAVLAEWAWRRHHCQWRAAGIVYAGLPAIALLVLRADPDYGLAATLWLLVTVWATDSAAFASGRLIGGPRIAPRVSPKKTWAGFVGGVLAAAIVGAIAARFIAGASVVSLAMVGAIISIAAQAGDFFESAVKRRFGAKDSGKLIPGHGGLMDRVDGLLFAALLAAGLGVLRMGPELAGSGILLW